MAKSQNAEIRAAGVVLLKGTGADTLVAVVHRPHHKDWSLPKGKLERGEHVVAAAARETQEETGASAVLGVPLATSRYRADGRAKVVHYWVATTASKASSFTPNSEIDKLEWLTPDKAAKRLTFPRDVQLMRAAVNTPPTTPLVILRHAQARRRASWGKRPDQVRPLAADGKRQARQLVPILAAFGIKALYSSDATRCVDTLVPYANSIKASIELEHAFSEEGFEAGKGKSLKRLGQLLATQEPLVLCTHRPVLPDLVKQLTRQLGVKESEHLNPALPPGGFIILHREFHPKKGLRVAAVERHGEQPH